VGAVRPKADAAVTRALRGSGLYAPLRLLREGLPAEGRQRYAELRVLRRRAAPLRARSRRRDGPLVLIPAIEASVLALEVNAVLAKALELAGARPVFVTFRHSWWSEEYLRALGQRDLVHVDDYLSPRAGYEAQAAELLDGCRSVGDLLALRRGGAEVGRPAASRAMKWTKQGRLDLDEVRDTLVFALTDSLWFADAAERLVADLRPAKLLAYEAYSYTPSAQFFDAALRRGIDTILWMRSPLEYTLLFRRYDYEQRHDHFFSLTDETWDEVREASWSPEHGRALVERLRGMYLQGHWFMRKDVLRDKRTKSRDEVVAELGLDPSKRTAVIYSHVLYDATFWFGTSLFPDYGTWLVETIRRARENPRVNWIVKMHPENVTKSLVRPGGYELTALEEYRLLRQHFPELPAHVALMLPDNDANPLSLFDATDWGLTVRGTIGLELPCFGTPVLTAGTGGYSGRGFTLDSATVAEYLSALDGIHEIPPLDAETTALAQRFAHAVFFRKPIPIQSFRWEVVFGKESPLAFWLNVRSLEELRAAPDLRRFADWALASSRGDLVQPYEYGDVPAEALLASP
jgi:hypothetical protein